MNPNDAFGTGRGKSPLIYRDQSIVEIRSGGGCLSLFGLPFLLAGLFVMQIPLGIIPVQGGPSGPSGPWFSVFLILFGSVFAAVGAVLVFGRSGVIVDRGRGSITQWHGLLVPMKRSVYLLDSVRQVEMAYTSGDSDTAATWPISLSGEGIVKPISILQPASFIEARQAAEELSRFLQKPLMDSSAGERVVRDPGHLDESYRDRLRRSGEAVATLPPEPPGKRSQLERTADGFILYIPAAPVGGVRFLSLIFPLLFAAMAAWFFLPAILTLPMPDFIRYIFLGFIGLFFIAGPAGSAVSRAFRLKRQFERITLTRDMLRVEALKEGKHTTVEIPLSELEDLAASTLRGTMDAIEVPGMKKVPLGDMGSTRMPDGRPVPRFLLSLMKMVGSKGIIARSDKAVVEFAQGLDEVEVAWIFALIRKKIGE